MKTIFKMSVLFLMFLITLLFVMNTNSISQRKIELSDSAENSMRNVLKAKNINHMYDMSEEDMSLELIRNLAMNMNTDGDLQIDIMEINENGLIDLSLKTKFKNLNGITGEKSIRKTMIADEVNIVEQRDYEEYNHEEDIKNGLINGTYSLNSEVDFEIDNNGYIIGFNGNTNSYSDLIIIPSEIDGTTVKGIGTYVFRAKEGFKKVVLPNTITSIGDWSFGASSLEIIVIPPSVTMINEGAFYGDKIKTIKFINDSPPTFNMVYSYCIGSTSEPVDIYVPQQGFSAYTANLMRKAINYNLQYY